MPLSEQVEFITHHCDRVAPSVTWDNTYSALFLGVQPSHAIAKLVLKDLVAAERKFHLDQVRFLGGTASRFKLKTVVPNPVKTPRDPTDLASYTSFLLGVRSYAFDQAMSIEVILQVDSDTEYGRLGWNEYRGALKEEEVRQTLGGMSGEDEFMIDGLIDTFNADMQAIAQGYSLMWVKRSQPQINKVVTVVDNKTKTTRYYGDLYEPQVEAFIYRGVRTDNPNHRWFDVG